MGETGLEAENRVVLVSGANRGIGRAIAERLEEDGYLLSLGVRRVETLDEVVASMAPERVLRHRYEAQDPKLADQWVAATVERFGCIDALINNAAVFHRFRLEDGDEALLDEMWEVNVKGPLRLFQAAYPHLRNSGRGRVVNIVSLSGKRLKSAAVAGYGMTKHALAAFTQGVRYSGWEHGIRATAICPGYVNTDMAKGLSGIPADDMAQPEAVAAVVSTVLALPNNASVVEVPINCVLEHSY